MFVCVIELFGLPEDITSLPKIEISLPDAAGLEDVISALRLKVPVLEGPVICIGADRLLDNFGFYINGHYYAGDEEVHVKNGDRVVLLALATGG